MHVSRLTLSALAALAVLLVRPAPAAHPQGLGSGAAHDVTVQLPDRRLDVSILTTMPAPSTDIVPAGVRVTLTNTGTRPFIVQSADFMLSAEGDMFAQAQPTAPPTTLSGTVAPGSARAGSLTFLLPAAALPRAALLYRPLGESLAASVLLGGSATLVPATSVVTATIQTYALSGGDGDPWGTAIDAAGNVWFAEPGCDFAPTCSPTTPPGQLGELLAISHTVRFYTLPNIGGNQPVFVALDRAGNVWFTTPNNSMIGEFDPTTQSFVGQWPVTPGSGPWDLAIANGKIWYTEHLVSAVGRFNPSTHAHHDFPTPSANTNPYGIAASGNLIWFTENNSSVARIAMLDRANHDQISEYLIRAQLPANLTPHLLAVDASGHPWWTEGWVRAIGTLNPQVATPGRCGASAGECTGVQEFSLPAPPSTCNTTHVSGIAIQGGGSLIWLDDSLATQVGSYAPSSAQFALQNLTCGVHPHDGLNLDPALHVWWDEEFANALGELIR